MKSKIYTFTFLVRVEPLNNALVCPSVLHSVINRTKPLISASSCCVHLMSVVCELSHTISTGSEFLANKQINKSVFISMNRYVNEGQKYSGSVSNNHFNYKHDDEISYLVVCLFFSW